MHILGLTGGSGTGKSTVSHLLQQKGAGVVDADAIYHKLCTECHPMLQKLEQAFGPVISEKGLNRPALAKIVFSNSNKLALLNEITTPFIREASIQAIDALSHHELVLYDAPTLFETGADSLCQGVIGVIAAEEIRIQRVMARDTISKEEAFARLHAQPPNSFYQEKCNYIIENNGSLLDLQCAVNSLYTQILGGK